MFAKEVELADCYQTILRGNGLPTKIMLFCFKLYGSHYLYNLFAPILAKMFIADLLSYEVDPSRIEQHEQLDENRKNLRLLTQDVFQAIIDSAPQFPLQLRILCSCLYQVVQQRFPQHPQQVFAKQINSNSFFCNQTFSPFFSGGFNCYFPSFSQSCTGLTT